MRRPEPLKAGDTIRIIAPSGRVNPADLEYGLTVFSSWGLSVEMGRNMFKSRDMFSANDEKRLEDIQDAINDQNVKAIICARGGYGTNRIIDKIDFTAFEQSPKWLVGFSDITVLHSHIQKQYNIETIHGPMAKTITRNSQESAIESLRKALFGEVLKYKVKGSPDNIPGTATGIITGGNLSILYSLIGTCSEPEWQDKILFIEEIGEYHYHLDRMLVSMKRAGVFEKISGLIVGHLTNMKDPEPGMQRTMEETILEHVQEYGIPIAFKFPSGHEQENLSLQMGSEVEFIVGKEEVELRFMDNKGDEKDFFSMRRMIVAGAVMVSFFVIIWMLYSMVLKKYL